MKILLIHPYITSDGRDTVLTEPLGLAYLAACLTEHEVKIIDLYAMGFNELTEVDGLFRRGISEEKKIAEMIKAFSPDVVGITCNFTSYAPDAYEVAQIAKSSINKTLIVLGGAHASMNSEEVLGENKCVDVVVRGEGEITFRELIEAHDAGRELNNIAGITYREPDGEIISNPKRPLISDLNVLPMPDRSKLQMDTYLNINSMSMPFAKREPVATLMTSRGCPFNCIFCSTKVVWERKFRPRTAENVISEIEHLVSAYGVREIAIMDDQFVANKARVHQICDMLIEKRVNVTISIPSGTSVWIVDEALLRKMRKAGFYRLCFPIETGNLNSLRFIRKPIDLQKAKETIKLANRLGFWTQGNFMIGFPYETREEIQETIEYAYQSGLDYALFYIAKPHAGSEMYDIFEQEGLLPEIARGANHENSYYDTKTMTAFELQDLRDKASNGYLWAKLSSYLNPINFCSYVLPKVSSPEGFMYGGKAISRIIKKALHA